MIVRKVFCNQKFVSNSIFRHTTAFNNLKTKISKANKKVNQRNVNNVSFHLPLNFSWISKFLGKKFPGWH